MIRIGASNWSQQAIRATLPKAKLAPGAMLTAYSRVLDTVEINSTFYRFHQAKTFLGWRELVPEGFLFAIKANQLFTHDRALERPGEELEGFLSSILGLGDRLGPVLFQLPQSLHADVPLLKVFFSALKPWRARVRFAFELRHPSWHAAETYRALEAAGAAFCVFDIRQRPSPAIVTADFTYTRLHGPLKLPYRGSYGREGLESWARLFADWEREGLASHVYFDNTMFGEAVPDALELARLLGLSAVKLRQAA